MQGKLLCPHKTGVEAKSHNNVKENQQGGRNQQEADDGLLKAVYYFYKLHKCLISMAILFSLIVTNYCNYLGNIQKLPITMNSNCLDVPEMWLIMSSSYTSVCWWALSTADWVQLNSYQLFI